MYNINDIKKFIPHRYPFLLIDRVIEVEKGNKIVGEKNITYNEPFFRGHFPDHPVMPGVLVIESMAQLAAVLAVLTSESESKGIIPLFTGIKNAKFRRQVIPGDKLKLTLKVLKTRRSMWKLYGEARVDGELAAEAEIQAVMQEGT